MKNDSEQNQIAIIAITKKGIHIARRIQDVLSNVDVYIPNKFYNSECKAIFFNEPVAQKIEKIFSSYNSLICIFSLGAVIRLISPFIKDKKTDPAIIVIDDASKFVISTLSGHLGGANDLTLSISEILKSIPVITTAADVNNTISVDLVGRKFNWKISNYENVTKVSAMMVNEEIIGVFQDVGEKNWLNMDSLPKNVEIVQDIQSLQNDKYKAALIITDKTISEESLLSKSVIYRPKTLVVGVGIHWGTTKETIEKGINEVLLRNHLSFDSIKFISSIDKGKAVKGLDEFCKSHNLDLLLYSKEQLSQVQVPNPSVVVGSYEGTASVSEASSLLSSNDGILIVPKVKFPPDLTVAISRINIK